MLVLILEQLLNGLEFGVMLFLLAAGLTLVFGIMNLINLTHGSLYMIGAFAATWTENRTGSFGLALLAGLAAAAAIGVALEMLVLRRFYARDHLDQVLATFGLILFFDEGIAMLFGRAPLTAAIPHFLSGSIEVAPGVPYPVYRLAIIGLGVAAALALYLFTNHTRIGMLVRAGATHRDMVRALGVRIGFIYTAVFGLGAVLAGLAGAVTGPLFSVQEGMGDGLLITVLVVIVIGGIGSIRGALVGSLLIGMIDTLTRAFAPSILATMMPMIDAQALGGGLSSMAVFIAMAVTLLVRPRGLIPAHA